MNKYQIILIVLVAIAAVLYVTHGKREVAAPVAPMNYTDVKWESYKKPDEATLRTMLSDTEFKVTQESATEIPYTSSYTDSEEVGLYVDIVSGEPLFSSKDKYHSGTGWPSFVKPITEDAVVYKKDTQLGTTRTEVRSRYADSHLGHVFDDGPIDRGGKRYCMNGVALRFVPLADMEKQGYGAYMQYVQ